MSVVDKVFVLFLIFLAVAMCMGFYEAWSKKRGLLGWIVSGIAAGVGAILGAVLTQTVLDTPKLLHLDGTVISTACMLAGALSGLWGALWIVNRFR